MRLLTKHSVLYTEMIHESFINQNPQKAKNLLQFDPIQHPVVIQLGGCDPNKLQEAALICQDIGYDEINLNVGCPSDRVQCGKFGACLMKEPETVSKIMQKMQQILKIPCTIKCRLGVDNLDQYEFLQKFVQEISENGKVQHFIVHARIAILKGLTPSQNRIVPSLKYDFVLQLKQDFPHIDFSINGGFKTFQQIENILKEENNLMGCMIGRLAYENPYFFSDVDRRFYKQDNLNWNRKDILLIWGQYGKHQMKLNKNLSVFILNRPILSLFQGEKHSSKYKQFISDKKNFEKCLDYENFIHEAIYIMEIHNPDVLYNNFKHL
ncbi:tRNA-dihydrouridine synthase a, putative [Ichthyophthirius multifiliis]|uniref:tRNA-dihydrouridine synthase n=1 Tax=Ichthyophthirius multifiliis TaxID=5932 RepID=G0QPC5_ICHMU|nr:tRNA-dihydrouridine synthase a, putative [Ichthyophthirius multifiliis]EGR32925.1 tRNA-dihydrouridine synthase a, putative [Ichthyophthirius multifiliis]|eukprot:XP_004036911.1 tRNA-dihydrouridine synthase a, putative [Ichthyophthirius multifiliis]